MDSQRRRALCRLAALAALPWAAEADNRPPLHRENLRLIAALAPPYACRGDQGGDGPAVSAARDLAKLAGYADPIELLPWHQALALADLAPATLIFPLERSPALESHFLWLTPLMADEWVLVSREEIEDESGADLRLAALKHSSGPALAGRLGHAPPVALGRPEDCLRALLAGRVDAWLTPQQQAEYLARRAGPAARRLHWTSGLAPFSLYLAAHRHLPDTQLRRWRNATRAGQRGGRFGDGEEIA